MDDTPSGEAPLTLAELQARIVGASEATRTARTEGLVGIPEPRIGTKPLRELTPATSFGFEAIDFARDFFGLELLEWQRIALIRSMELAEPYTTADPDAVFRFKTVLILVARQNGKSTLALVRLMWRLFLWRPRAATPTFVVSTAHKLSAAVEIWEHAITFAKRSPLAAPFIEKANGGVVRYVNGQNLVKLGLGLDSRWRVEAATDDGGRGLSADDLFFDELRQQKTWTPWAALTNTTTARTGSQNIAVSNAGEHDSVVLNALAESARESVDDPDTTTCILEWSAAPGRAIDDPMAMREANPSMGHLGDIEGSIRARLSRGEPEHKIRTENYCQQVAASVDGVFTSAELARCEDSASKIAEGSPITLAYDLSYDRRFAYLAVAGWRADGLPHIEVIARRAGSEWVIPVIAEGLTFEPASVVVQARGAPAASSIEAMVSAGIEVSDWPTSALGASCGQLADRVRAGTIRWRNQSALTLALADVVPKVSGEVFFWDRGRSSVDVAPLCAATFALWALQRHREDTPAESAYAEGSYGDWWDTEWQAEP